MSATFDNVMKILEAADKEPVGVWLIGKSVKIVPVSAKKRFDAFMKDNYKEFVAVYSDAATAAMVKGDLS